MKLPFPGTLYQDKTKSNNWYYSAMCNGKRTRISTKESDVDRAIEVARTLMMLAEKIRPKLDFSKNDEGIVKQNPNGTWRAEFSLHGKRIKRALKTTDKQQAVCMANELRSNMKNPRSSNVDYTLVLRDRLHVLNARNKKLGGDKISLDDLLGLYKRCNGRCELTGIPFCEDKMGATRAPFAMSIDRIDPHKPYVVHNMRMVCFAVNVAMNQWGEEVLRIIARSLR